jgi:hypothetical protein
VSRKMWLGTELVMKSGDVMTAVLAHRPLLKVFAGALWLLVCRFRRLAVVAPSKTPSLGETSVVASYTAWQNTNL